MLKNILRDLTRGRAQARTPVSLESAVALLDADRLDEAESMLRQLCIAQPDDAEPRHLLGHVLSRRGELAPAIAVLEQASELAPDDAAVKYSLGRTRLSHTAFRDAAIALRQAVEMAPAWPAASLALADALAAVDEVDEAEQHYIRALELAPEFAEAYYNYANLKLRLGRVPEAIAAYRRAVELKPDFRRAHSNLVYALNFVESHTPEEIFQEHVAWAHCHAEALTAQAQRQARRGSAGRVLRVGYVSANFREHAVTYFFEPVLRHHDKTRFEIYCYSDVKVPDARTARLREHAHVWRDISRHSDEHVCALVQEDEIDILVDLTGHTADDRLLVFARKPAPVQVTWNGYANTTGMTAVDYRISDPYADPPGMTEHLHTERLLRLPEIYMPFDVPADDVPVGALPAIDRRHVTFGAFNALSKVTSRMLHVWSRVLLAVPGARLMVLTVPEGRTRERLRNAFADHGIAAERLDLRPRLTHREFMEAYREVDIALDTYPFHGTTTTAHALWLGVPVVTLAGRAHVSRVGVSMLSNLGLSEMVAVTEEDYVRIAVAAARDTPRLQALRASLRARMLSAPNMDGPRFTRFLEEAYVKMWDHHAARST